MPRFGSADRIVGVVCAALLGCSSLLVTGCGAGPAAEPNPVSLTVNGKVHGGQQPVSGAQIQLYVAGDTGNGSAASPLLTKTVTSGSDGGFSITGDYSCPSASSQVYLVATQGNPGLGSGANNPALAMMAALGSCGNLTPTQFIWLDEVTTVAAAWALAPFEQDLTHIGASATNAKGLANAFLDAQLIADTSTGNAATLPSGVTTETGKIYALADAVAACVNTSGAGSPGCSALFSAATPSGGSAPTNTWDALLNIVKNPANNVAGVWNAIGSTPPFATALTGPPNDWTLSLTVTGAGINTPESVGVDSQGNVWVSNRSGIVSAVSPQGTPLSATGFGSANATEAYGLAIDPSDNVWITVGETPSHNGTVGSIERFSGVSSGGTLGTMTPYPDQTINYPYGIAVDSSNGNVLVANYFIKSPATSVAVFNPKTNTFTAFDPGPDIADSIAVAPDTAQGVWIAGGNGIGSAAHVDAGGNSVFSTNCCGPVTSIALDSSGNVWLGDGYNTSSSGGIDGSVTELAPDGTTLQPFITAGGIRHPAGLAIDAAQHVWVVNYVPLPGESYASVSELAGSKSSSPGAALSPSSGYGLDGKLQLPYDLAVDASGNVWVSNTSANSLVMFFGIAAPTKTPKPVTPVAP